MSMMQVGTVGIVQNSDIDVMETAKIYPLPVGTRIRFTKTLTEPACGDHPAFIYARKGELGEITGHGTREGYWAKWDRWPHPFGLSPAEFEPVG